MSADVQHMLDLVKAEVVVASSYTRSLETALDESRFQLAAANNELEAARSELASAKAQIADLTSRLNAATPNTVESAGLMAQLSDLLNSLDAITPAPRVIPETPAKPETPLTDKLTEAVVDASAEREEIPTEAPSAPEPSAPLSDATSAAEAPLSPPLADPTSLSSIDTPAEGGAVSHELAGEAPPTPEDTPAPEAEAEAPPSPPVVDDPAVTASPAPPAIDPTGVPVVE